MPKWAENGDLQVKLREEQGDLLFWAALGFFCSLVLGKGPDNVQSREWQ